MRPSLALRSAAAALSLIALPALAEPVYGLLTFSSNSGSAQYLDRFDSATPGVAQTFASNSSQLLLLQGIAAGQTLRSIDFRPSNGMLYALSSAGSVTNGGTAAQLYTVNIATGMLSAIGSGFSIAGNDSSSVAIDFNPVADRLRVVTGTGQNLRVNADTGLIAATDTKLKDSAGNVPIIAALAYTNNVAGATSTTLYGYDYVNDQLDTIGNVGGSPASPNAGQTFVVGDTKLLSDSTNIGLDIDAAGNAFGSVFDDTLGNYGFYSVNLATGAFSLIGSEAFALQDFAIQSAARVGAVPEPDSLALVGLGLAALGFTLRRRSRRAA